jgi:2-keto-3-deoxy-L-rhamnonate aldolase RhmA
MPALMRPNPVRANLQAGGNVYGTMAFEFFSPGLMAILAEAGADFVLLDTERSGVGIETIKAQLAACRGWFARGRLTLATHINRSVRSTATAVHAP